MLAVRISKTLEGRLEHLAVETKRSKSFYVKEAIAEYLEANEDFLLAMTRLAKKNPRIPLKELEKKLGLES